jgi:hypothetical protein
MDMAVTPQERKQGQAAERAETQRAEISKPIEQLFASGMTTKAAIAELVASRGVGYQTVSARYYRHRREVLGIGRPWDYVFNRTPDGLPPTPGREDVERMLVDFAVVLDDGAVATLNMPVRLSKQDVKSISQKLEWFRITLRSGHDDSAATISSE